MYVHILYMAGNISLFGKNALSVAELYGLTKIVMGDLDKSITTDVTAVRIM